MQKKLSYLCLRVKKRNASLRCISRQLQRGQALLEALLALAIIVLVIGAVMQITSGALSNAQYVKNQNLATFYAKEGMSSVRQIRDSSWSNFSTLAPYTEPISGSGGIAFERRTSFNNSGCGTGGIKTTVAVFWTDNKCDSGSPLCHKVELVNCFLNINNTP